MSRFSALIVHHQTEALERIRQALDANGFSAQAYSSQEQAVDYLEKSSSRGSEGVHVLLTEINDGSNEGSATLAHLRSNPFTENTPVVVLTSASPDQRRLALRLGLTHLVIPPYDPEELILRTKMAVDQRLNDQRVSGSLSQLPVTDLLQTAEASRKTGTISLTRQGQTGTLWLNNGRVIDAELDGERGTEAALRLIGWQRGAFEADFGPVNLPERIHQPISYLLLEAMRRQDEANRDEMEPLHAALPEVPPIPPLSLRVLHHSLALTNITASYATEYLDGRILHRKMEDARSQAASTHGVLELFSVVKDGRVSLPTHLESIPDPEQVVAGVADWLRRFFADAERAYPGPFKFSRLRSLTLALQPELKQTGFLEALDFSEPVDANDESDAV